VHIILILDNILIKLLRNVGDGMLSILELKSPIMNIFSLFENLSI